MQDVDCHGQNQSQNKVSLPLACISWCNESTETTPVSTWKPRCGAMQLETSPGKIRSYRAKKKHFRYLIPFTHSCFLKHISLWVDVLNQRGPTASSHCLNHSVHTLLQRKTSSATFILCFPSKLLSPHVILVFFDSCHILPSIIHHEALFAYFPAVLIPSSSPLPMIAPVPRALNPILSYRRLFESPLLLSWPLSPGVFGCQLSPSLPHSPRKKNTVTLHQVPCSLAWSGTHEQDVWEKSCSSPSALKHSTSHMVRIFRGFCN